MGKTYKRRKRNTKKKMKSSKHNSQNTLRKMKSKRRVTKRRKRTRMHGGAAADSTALITHVFNGSLSGVKEEIKNGQNINEVKNEMTALIAASVKPKTENPENLKRDIDIVNHLLKNGADPNVETNSVFKYALTWAAFHNKLEVMESLINFVYKDDLRIKVDKASMTNRTPLMIVIDNIVNNRDNIDKKYKDLKKIQNSFDIIILLLENGADVNKADNSNHTAVTQAITKRDEIINLLPEKRADVNKADDSNHTTVNRAIHMMNHIIFILRNIEAIKGHKAPNAYSGKYTSNYTTPLLPEYYTHLNNDPTV